MSIDTKTMTDFLIGLLNTPSPTGFAEKAVEYTERAFARFPFKMRRTVKGALVAEWEGKASDAPRALTAHVDTLGAMVKEIKENGRLKLTKVGGFVWNTVEGEGCTVFTTSGRTVRGSLLLVKASSHVFGAEVGEAKRDDDAMEMRLDERTTSAAETRALGIEVGDFVAFDPRVEAGPAGFIRSRHLDDKAAVACIFGAATAMLDAGIQPAQRTTIHISNYEEVGHGAASGFPPDIVELLTVDMAAVGKGQASDEFSACICVKDSGGPYHVDMNRKLTRLAQAAGIPHKVDIYPYYGSDGEAFWRAGGDVRVGLVGPGVDASHNYERTHADSLVHTAQLLAEYLRTE
ncbi:MAG: peptidase M42 family protein [Anaerolineales bacterium]|nr:peptidase M42 family protein [Anaerolineales bacterium]